MCYARMERERERGCISFFKVREKMERVMGESVYDIIIFKMIFNLSH